MSFKILFKEVKRSAANELKVHEKVAKWDHFFMKDPDIKWNSYKHGDKYYSEVTVWDGDHKFHAKAEHENLYKTFDLVGSKMYKQLHKYSTKAKNKIHRREKHVDFDTRPLHKRYAA